MSGEIVSLGFGGLTAPPGAHIAYTYDHEHRRYQDMLGFIATGLANNEKCIAAVGEYTPHRWLDGLRSVGVNPDSLPAGQLRIVTAADFAHPDPSRSLAAALHMLTQSLGIEAHEAWNGVRSCTGFMHFYHKKKAVTDLVLAESSTNDVVRRGRATMLCTFSKMAMNPGILDLVLCSHPLVVQDGSVRENAGYVPPGHLKASLPESVRRLEQSGAFANTFGQLDFHDGIPVIRTCEELDFFNSPRLEELADEIMEMGHRRIVVDLSTTTYLDASTVGVFLRVARALRANDGQLTLCDPRDPVRRIFEILNLDHYIPIVRTLDSALDEDQLPKAA